MEDQTGIGSGVLTMRWALALLLLAPTAWADTCDSYRKQGKRWRILFVGGVRQANDWSKNDVRGRRCKSNERRRRAQARKKAERQEYKRKKDETRRLKEAKRKAKREDYKRKREERKEKREAIKAERKRKQCERDIRRNPKNKKLVASCGKHLGWRK